MKRVVATGKTVDDAVTSALVRLGATRSQASVRVIREPVNRLFGILRSKDAEVEVTVIPTPEELACEFLADVLEKMDLHAKVRVRNGIEENEPVSILDIVCDEADLPVVIGRHGVTLDSFQYLVNTVANRGQEKPIRVRVDAGEYRKKRRDGLEQIANRALDRALKTKKPVALESMPASERKVIHTFLQDRREVTTTSEGTEPHRHVVVIPVGVEHVPHRNRSRSDRRGSVRIERSEK